MSPLLSAVDIVIFPVVAATHESFTSNPWAVASTNPLVASPPPTNFRAPLIKLPRAELSINLINDLYTFCYYINSPKGSSPLVFSTSKKKFKPELGKLLIFDARLFHEIPINKGEFRCVLSGNFL